MLQTLNKTPNGMDQTQSRNMGDQLQTEPLNRQGNQSLQAQIGNQSQMISPNKTNRRLKEGSNGKDTSFGKGQSKMGGASNNSIMDQAAHAVGSMRRTKNRFYNQRDSNAASDVGGFQSALQQQQMKPTSRNDAAQQSYLHQKRISSNLAAQTSAMQQEYPNY